MGSAPSPQQMVKAQFGQSKIVRMDCDAKAGIDHVLQMIGNTPQHSKARPVSASVVFTLPDNSSSDVEPERGPAVSEQPVNCSADVANEPVASEPRRAKKNEPVAAAEDVILYSAASDGLTAANDAERKEDYV